MNPMGGQRLSAPGRRRRAAPLSRAHTSSSSAPTRTANYHFMSSTRRRPRLFEFCARARRPALVERTRRRRRRRARAPISRVSIVAVRPGRPITTARRAAGKQQHCRGRLLRAGPGQTAPPPPARLESLSAAAPDSTSAAAHLACKRYESKSRGRARGIIVKCAQLSRGQARASLSAGPSALDNSRVGYARAHTHAHTCRQALRWKAEGRKQHGRTTTVHKCAAPPVLVCVRVCVCLCAA